MMKDSVSLRRASFIKIYLTIGLFHMGFNSFLSLSGLFPHLSFVVLGQVVEAVDILALLPVFHVNTETPFFKLGFEGSVHCRP